MEETKELQSLYRIFRYAIYVSVLMEFFEYAIDPETLDLDQLYQFATDRPEN